MLKKAVISVVSAVLLTALALAPAVASATTVHEKSSTGPSFSGQVKAVASNPKFVTSFGAIKCATATLEGSLGSSGSGEIKSGTFLNATNGRACATSVTGVTAVVSALALPWMFDIVYEPTKIPITFTGVALKAEFSNGDSCIYEVVIGGVQGKWLNPSTFETVETKFTLGSGSSATCPSSGDLDEATWQLAPNDLYVTS